jgi:hypothetical protein
MRSLQFAGRPIELNNTRIFKVKSKDKEYTVLLKDNNYNCNCIGFGYRGKCKHSDAVAKKQQAS